jgi:hypothetical protein
MNSFNRPSVAATNSFTALARWVGWPSMIR